VIGIGHADLSYRGTGNYNMSLVTIQPRDVVFSFTDSCNCCFKGKCSKGEPAKDEAVYVNSSGDLEKFSNSKSRKNVEASFERAKANMMKALRTKLILVDGDMDDFNGKAKSILLSMEALGKIKIAHIDSINELMIDHLRIKSEESDAH